MGKGTFFKENQPRKKRRKFTEIRSSSEVKIVKKLVLFSAIFLQWSQWKNIIQPSISAGKGLKKA
jgi:hypothetical protein